MLAPPPSRSAAKKRRQRERWRDGKICLTVEIDRDEFVETLLAAHRLTEAQALDRTELARAAGRGAPGMDSALAQAVAMVPFVATTMAWIVSPALTAPRAHNGFLLHCLTEARAPRHRRKRSPE